MGRGGWSIDVVVCSGVESGSASCDGRILGFARMEGVMAWDEGCHRRVFGVDRRVAPLDVGRTGIVGRRSPRD